MFAVLLKQRNTEAGHWRSTGFCAKTMCEPPPDIDDPSSALCHGLLIDLVRLMVLAQILAMRKDVFGHERGIGQDGDTAEVHEQPT